MTPLESRPFRTLLVWQAIAIPAFAALGWLWADGHGGASGALGAAINLVANFVYAMMGGIVQPRTPIGALFLVLRAEAFKVGLVLVQLLFVMVLYRDLASGPFLVAFIATTLMFGMALRIRSH